MNARNDGVGHGIATEGEAEVVWCAHQHVFNLSCDLIVHVVKAEVQVLELRASLQEPVGCFVAVTVTGNLALQRVKNGDGLFRLLLLLQFFVFLDDRVSLLELTLVGLNLVSRKGNLAEAVKDGHQVISCELVLRKTEEFERTVLLKDRAKLLDYRATEVVVRKVKHLQVAVHGQRGVWLQSQHNVLQVLVLEATGSQEDNLKLFAFRDELGKEAHFLGLVFFRGRLHLIKSVGPCCGVAGLKFLGMDGVPVEEQVRDRAVIFTQIADQSGQLRVRQTIVAEPTSDEC